MPKATTAVQSTPAPAAPAAAAQVAPTAERKGPAPGPNYNPEVQQDETAFVSRVAKLFGDSGDEPEETAPTTNKQPPESQTSLPDDSPEPRQTPGAESAIDEGEKDAPKGTTTDKPDGQSVLPDAEDETTDPEAEADESALDKGIQSKLYKLRQSRRELRASLEAKESEIASLKAEASKQTASRAPIAGMPDDFAHVNDEAKLAEINDWLTDRLDFLDDHKDGFVEKVNDEEVDRDSEWVREQRAQLRKWHRLVPTAEKALAAHRARQSAADELAAKRYPFVTNTASPHHALVQKLAQENPALASVPERSVLLGRLAVAKLVEDGVYVLRKPDGTKPTTAPAPPSSAPVNGSPRPAPAVAPSTNGVTTEGRAIKPLNSNDPAAAWIVAELMGI